MHHQGIIAKPGISQDPETAELAAVLHFWIDREDTGDPDFVWVDESVRFPKEKPNKVRRHIKKVLKPRIRGMIQDLRIKVDSEYVSEEEDEFGTTKVRGGARLNPDTGKYQVMVQYYDVVHIGDSTGVSEFYTEDAFDTMDEAMTHFQDNVRPRLKDFLEEQGVPTEIPLPPPEDADEGVPE